MEPHSPNLRRRFVCRLALVGCGLLAAAILAEALPVALAQSGEGKELIAVLELDHAGATPEQASAITDRLREEMLHSGAFKLINRSQLNSLLSEQALQQTMCTTQECAVKVGRILGIRKIVAGKVTRLSDDLWQLSALMVDVETAETLRADTVIHEGGFVGLLRGGVTEMGRRLSGRVAPAAARPGGGGTAFEFDVPEQASIFLNGKKHGQGAQRISELLPGTYDVVVRLPDKRPFKQSIFLPPDQTLKVKPEFQRLRMAIFPVRRTGNWRSSLEHTRGWATQALVEAASEFDIDITRTAHIKGGPYPSAAGADLTAQDDLESGSWSFFGGLDQTFVLTQGRTLGVDLVLAFQVDASAGTGTWSAYLVDVESGKVQEEQGNFPYSGGVIPVVTKGVRAFLESHFKGR